jgi:hypothetical protein
MNRKRSQTQIFKQRQKREWVSCGLEFPELDPEQAASSWENVLINSYDAMTTGISAGVLGNDDGCDALVDEAVEEFRRKFGAGCEKEVSNFNVDSVSPI